jgi:hypothetical protein
MGISSHTKLPARARPASAIHRGNGTDRGFRFDLPCLDLYIRCLDVSSATVGFLREPATDAAVNRLLEKLQRIAAVADGNVIVMFKIWNFLQSDASVANGRVPSLGRRGQFQDEPERNCGRRDAEGEAGWIAEQVGQRTMYEGGEAGQGSCQG